MDLAALQAECGRLLGDPNHDRWSTDLLTTRINLAQSDIGVYARSWFGNSVYSLTAGSRSVDLGATSYVIDITEVTIERPNGDVVPLRPISLFELDFRYPDWRQWDDGDPILWYADFTASRIVVVPAPNADAAAVTTPVTIRSSRRFADMTATTDVPFGSNNFFIPFHMAIVHWAVAQCWMDDGTPEALAKSKFHRSGDLQRPGQYEGYIKELIARADVPTENITRIMWQPEGGRLGSWGTSKSSPLSF